MHAVSRSGLTRRSAGFCLGGGECRNKNPLLADPASRPRMKHTLLQRDEDISPHSRQGLMENGRGGDEFSEVGHCGRDTPERSSRREIHSTRSQRARSSHCMHHRNGLSDQESQLDV